MLPPLPPRPPARPQSLGDRILDLQSLLARVDAEIAKFHAWIETARGHLTAGRLTPAEFDFNAAVLRRQIAAEESIRPGIAAELAEARAAFAAQVAEGAAFNRWATQRHAATIAGQPAPVAEEGEALARAIVAAPRFEWASGMQYLVNGRLYTRLNDDDFFGKIILPPDHLPNLGDARTLDALRRIAGASAEASPAEILAALEGGANA